MAEIIVWLKVRFDNTHYVVKFVVAENSAVNEVIGTNFLNEYVVKTRCLEQLNKFRRDMLPILGVGKRLAVENTPQGGVKTKLSMALNKKMTTEISDSNSKRREVTSASIYEIVSGKMRLEKSDTIPAMSHEKVAVVSELSGLGTVELNKDSMIKYRLRVTNGVI